MCVSNVNKNKKKKRGNYYFFFFCIVELVHIQLQTIKYFGTRFVQLKKNVLNRFGVIRKHELVNLLLICALTESLEG